MSSRTNAQRAARSLQKLTDWKYQECLRLTSSITVDAIVALATIKGKPIDTANPEYAKLVRRGLGYRLSPHAGPEADGSDEQPPPEGDEE